MKDKEKRKLLKEFKRWFFDQDIVWADKELLKLYGGKKYGWIFFIAYCAGYALGKKLTDSERGKGMKRVIERLERAEANIMLATGAKLASGDMRLLTEAISYLNDAITELKTPSRWETPERWKKRTGKELPDDFPVWDWKPEEAR